MSKTFFISSSSVQPQRDKVQELAKQLYQKFGWRWHFDWTEGFAEENQYPEHEMAYRAKMDISAATNCDVFIWLESPVISYGSNREYGARMATGGVIYRVSQKSEHIFDMLRGIVTSVPNVEELLKVLERREH